MMNTTTIVKVLRVVDTRQYDEIGDRWVPIPGSGHEHECFRCGKLHEVHAHVLLSDNREVIVGTGCAAKDNMEMAATFKSLDSAAKRLARLKAEHAAYLKAWEAYEAVWNEVCALPLPPLEKTEGTYAVGRVAGQKYPALRCGDAEVRCCLDGYTAEREACVIHGWRQNRMNERGFNYFQRPRPRVDYARDIAKLEKKVAEVTAPEAYLAAA